jgi:Flp pilus assembly protein TadG
MYRTAPIGTSLGALIACAPQACRRFLSNDRAAISPMMAVMLIPISGSIAYAVELGAWQYTQRSAQNAADAAAIAAASNNNQTGTGSTYLAEARAAAKPYGFINGQGNVTVTSAPVTCPVGATGSVCYEAVINTVLPLTFSSVLGFTGTQVLGSGRGQLINARAVATASGGGGTKEVCVLSLSSVGVTFQSNGGPKPDMAGCTIASNGGMTCNGHNLGATYGVAVGTNNGCGVNTISNASPISDPYAAKASNIPSSTCADSPSDNSLSADITGSVTYCGNLKLTKDISITGADSVITIKNGVLDLNGFTLKTTGTGTATVVFGGTNSSSRSHFLMSSKNKQGTIDIQAPTSTLNSWKGIAIYTDPNLTNNVSFTYAGNEPTWNITGLVYFPKADITFSGAVNKAANGTSCFVLVAYTVLVNGTANIFANNTQCASAGLSTPTTSVGTGTREKLVL